MLPQLLVVNPMAKHRRRRRNPESHRARVRAAHKGWRSRKRHRNPESVGARRRAARLGWRHRRAHNPFAKHHRHHKRRHRNPFDINTGEMGNDLFAAAIGGTGGVALDIALAYAPLPTGLQSGMGNYLTKIVGSFALGMLAGAVAGERNGQMVTVGALTVSLYTIIRAVAQSTIGANVKGLSGLADFKDYRIGAYMTNPGAVGPTYMHPAAVVQRQALAAPAQTMGAYMRPRPMGAYMRPTRTMGAYMRNSMAMRRTGYAG